MTRRRKCQDEHLTPLEYQALRRAADQALRRDRSLVEPGNDRPIDVTLRIHGLLHVGEATRYSATKYPRLDDLVATIFGALGPAGRRKVHTAVAERFAAALDPPPETEPSQGAKQAAEDLLATVAKCTSAERKGAISGELHIDLVDRGG